MKLYLAGPLFTAAERSFNVRLARYLEGQGHEIWLPQEKEPRERNAQAIFEKDCEGMDWADGIVANMDGPDPDSGTSWECCYGYGDKPVMAYRTDFRSIDDGNLAPYNLMLSASVNDRIELPFATEEVVFAEITKMIARCGDPASWREGAWMQTAHGRKFYPLTPDAADVHLDDIATALSNICRFGGQTPIFYTVAQHSVLVSQQCATADALWGLLHDAAEAYVGDMIRPIKHGGSMGKSFRKIEDRVVAVIAEHFGLELPMPKSVKIADEVVLATEARDIMGGECAGKWTLRYPPSDNVITAWSPKESEQAFLARFAELDAARRTP